MKKPVEQEAVDSFAADFIKCVKDWNSEEMNDFFIPLAEKISRKFIELCSGYEKTEDNTYYFYYNCKCTFDSRAITEWVVTTKCQETFYDFVQHDHSYFGLITEIQNDDMKDFYNRACYELCQEIPGMKKYHFFFEHGYELPVFFPDDVRAERAQCNILVSTGEDYISEIHNVFFGKEKLKPVHGKSVLNWLATTQTMPLSMIALYGARKDFEVTLLQEIKNYQGEAKLVFPVLLSVEELYDFIHNKKNLYIGKGSLCGLYNPETKKCGQIGIEIEKNLALPFSLFSEIEIETSKDPNHKETYRTTLNRINPMKSGVWKRPLSPSRGKSIDVITPNVFSDLECSQLYRY